ncbi:hypothetical protein PC110_g22510 [Phytophthora cactorum]|uniref:Uncharacterized protein n=2 Tax=Phytophthora cactorum TaxID=29920 RepID=A0A329RCP3_9STRA|nr:hypothetical protein PC110_g22510 [Phytophthora cactorum]
MAAPPTPEAAVDPPVMPFDGIFPDFDDEEEDTARVLRRLRRGSTSSAAKVPREVEADVRLLTKVPLEQSARAIPAAATPAAPAFATPATPARATRRVVHNVLLPRHPERHLGNRHRNHFDPKAPYDRRKNYGLSYFMDRPLESVRQVYKPEMTYGVKRKDMAEVFKFLER